MKLKRVVGFAILAAASIVCMAASGGCGSSLHKAEVSAGAIAASLHTAATTNHTNTLETPEERTLIATYISQAASANDNFIGVLKSAEVAGGTPNTAAIVTAFSDLSKQIEQLNSEGILHLKSTQAQADFSLIMSSIQGEIAIIQGLYPAPASASAGRRPPVPLRRYPLPVAALVLTAEEIEELVSLAIAAGSTLVPKLLALKGQTGAEILSGASADDIAAEQIAESDGAPALKT
jgi:hypothetical protein